MLGRENEAARAYAARELGRGGRDFGYQERKRIVMGQIEERRQEIREEKEQAAASPVEWRSMPPSQEQIEQFAASGTVVYAYYYSEVRQGRPLVVKAVRLAEGSGQLHDLWRVHGWDGGFFRWSTRKATALEVGAWKAAR